MADLTQAVNCVNYHQSVAAQIKRVPVQLQYSATHKELKPDQVLFKLMYNFDFCIKKI